MRISYQYRIQPTTEQKLKLNSVRRSCQYLYNRMLADKLYWWENNRCPVNSCSIICCPLPELRINPNYNAHQDLLPSLKEDLIFVECKSELLDLGGVYSQVLQDTVKRVHLAFDRYIKGDKNGRKCGKPRFKSESSFKSFTYTQVLEGWLNGNQIKLPKIGEVKIVLHRPIPDGFKIKTCIVSKKADGWYITLSLEDKTVPTAVGQSIIPSSANSLGLDAVLHENTFLATSDADFFPAVKAYRTNQEKLALVSAQKSTKKKRSAPRRKLTKKERLLHQKIARSRSFHHFNVAHKLVDSGRKKIFFLEDLDLKNLTKRNKAKQDEEGKYLHNGQSQKSGLNKSFLDAGFGQFVDILSYIAAKAGGQVVKVNPNYTSQICCNCDAYCPKELSDRIHSCKACGIEMDRDINAAINIKRVGLGVFPTIKRRRGKLIIESHDSMSTSKKIQELT